MKFPTLPKLTTVTKCKSKGKSDAKGKAKGKKGATDLTAFNIVSSASKSSLDHQAACTSPIHSSLHTFSGMSEKSSALPEPRTPVAKCKGKGKFNMKGKAKGKKGVTGMTAVNISIFQYMLYKLGVALVTPFLSIQSCHWLATRK